MQKPKLKVSAKAFCIAQQVQIESTLKFEKLLYAVTSPDHCNVVMEYHLYVSDMQHKHSTIL